MLVVNDERFIDRAEVIRDKGTNRSQFFRGMVDKYSWVDIGSSYLPSELQAAFLWAQLQQADAITSDRINTWNLYYKSLEILQAEGKIQLQVIPDECCHNGHIFYLKCVDLAERTRFIEHMKMSGILTVFHYVPLHSSKAGREFSCFHGVDRFTTSESNRLVRLPMWFGIDESTQLKVIKSVISFFH